jgi:hypothetical protein
MAIVPVEHRFFFDGGETDWEFGIRDESDMWAHLVSDTMNNPGQDFFFPTCQTAPGFNLDRDSIVQGTNDRDSKFRVYFVEPLQVQGLK